MSAGIIGADDVWASGYDGSGQVVAILDDGIRADHQFFGGRVLYEACFSGGGGVSTSNCPNTLFSQTGAGAASMSRCLTNSGGADLCDHGTHVAGIAAGSGTTFHGVARNATIMAVNVFSWHADCSSNPGLQPCKTAWNSDILNALNYVYNQALGGVPVASVNMSLGNGSENNTACDAANPGYVSIVNQLRTVGVTVIAASGNDGYGAGISAPACVSNIVSVGSTTDTDQISGFTNAGLLLDFLAPGSSIYSSIASGTSAFANKNGTSMATPQLTGAWAVLRQVAPTADFTTIYNALQTTGTYITDGLSGLSFPRINLDQAVEIFTVIDILAPDAGTQVRFMNPSYTWEDKVWPEYYELTIASATKTYFSTWFEVGAGGLTCNGTTCTLTGLTVPIGEAAGITNLTAYIRGYSDAIGIGPYSSEAFSIAGPVPDGPTGTQNSPLNGIFTYAWDDVPGADYYRLYVANSAGTVMVDEWVADGTVCTGDDCAYEPGVSLANGVYTWYLQAYGAQGFTPWRGPQSLTVSMAQPAAPVPEGPLSGSFFDDNVITLEWTPGAGNTYYEIYVVGPGGTAAHNRWYALAELTETIDSTYTVNVPVSGTGSFTWYVRGYGPGGYSQGINQGWKGSTMSTTFIVNGVPVPTNLTNADPAATAGFLTYEWDHDGRNTYYELIVYNPITNASPISRWYQVGVDPALDCTGSGGARCVVDPGVMLANGTYNWFVRGYGASGFTTGGPYGNGYAGKEGVVVSLAAPNSDQLLVAGFTVMNNETLDEIDDPGFQWNDVANAAYYELYVQRLSDGAVMLNQWYIADDICDSGTCRFWSDLRLLVGNYRWYVRPYGPGGYGTGGGHGNGFAGPASFNISSSGVSAPTLSAPAASATVTMPSPTFEWTPASGATWYELVIATPTWQVVFQQWKHFSYGFACGLGTCTWSQPVTLPNGNYVWTVRAYGPSGLISAYAPPRNLTVAVPVPPVPTLVSPANDGVSPTNNVTFTWNMNPNGAGSEAVTTYYYLSVTRNNVAAFGQWLDESAVCNAGTCSQTVPLAGGLYQWRVYAYGAGSGTIYPESATRNLRVLE